MTSPVLDDHNWPAMPETHVWTMWFPFSRTHQHRSCAHPRCAAVQYREVKGDVPGPPTTERPNR